MTEKRDLIQKIKKACTLSWEHKLPLTLTWQEAAAVMDTIQFLGDVLAEEGWKRVDKYPIGPVEWSYPEFDVYDPKYGVRLACWNGEFFTTLEDCSLPDLNPTHYRNRPGKPVD
jgi:hypothetical protein